MTPDDFYVAKLLENEGWEYNNMSDDGVMVFTRTFLAQTWVIRVGVDR